MTFFPVTPSARAREISTNRNILFRYDFSEGKQVILPEPIGFPDIFTRKVYLDYKDFPDCNVVGRIIGPRGMTAQELENETGCQLIIRGKGSVRELWKEMKYGGFRGFDHLNDNLHVLIICADTPNRAMVKIRDCEDKLKKLITPRTPGADEFKRKQLIELALLNGTYRPSPHHFRKPHPVLSAKAPRAKNSLTEQVEMLVKNLKQNSL
ncbi:hypothetical protein L596_000731 [Steinernema carpocapsae]|uniref:K Homology domain-containing protein n=1 Tax=Steinernema carpocapsae TaxID=34508 RepID=A0A4V6I6Y8_STECR|nr:hypothetical protein L596_000731 [Steinernema carpocapsae]